METSAEALLDAGRFEEALAQVSGRIRVRPNDANARALLFTLLCCGGQTERAYQQLQTWATIEPSAMPGLVAYERLLSLDHVRQKVFAGNQPPPLREPADQSARHQAEVLRLWCIGRYVEAAQLFLERPSVELHGTWDDKPFNGLEDFDARFGMLLEVFLPEGYFLVPLTEVQTIAAEPPRTYLDSIWRPVVIQLANTMVPAYLPTRYPGSEKSAEPLVRLSRKTVCEEPYPGFFTGSGQHFWVTRDPEGDFGSLAFQSLKLSSAVTAPDQL